MAVAEFQGQFYNPKDLAAFSSACGVNVTVDKNVGEHLVGDGVEAELDIEYIKGECRLSQEHTALARDHVPTNVHARVTVGKLTVCPGVVQDWPLRSH